MEEVTLDATPAPVSISPAPAAGPEILSPQHAKPNPEHFVRTGPKTGEPTTNGKRKRPGNVWKKDKPFRPGEKMRGAIYEIIGRKRIGLKPGFREVAEKWDVKQTSLQTLFGRYEKGLVVLDERSPNGNLEERLKAEGEKTLRLLSTYEQMMNNVFEQALKKAKAEIEAGNLNAPFDLNLQNLRKELEGCRKHRQAQEKGSFEYLDQATQAALRANNPQLQPRSNPPGTILIQQNNNFPASEPAIHPSQAMKLAAAAGVTPTVVGRVEREMAELEQLLAKSLPAPGESFPNQPTSIEAEATPVPAEPAASNPSDS